MGWSGWGFTIGIFALGPLCDAIGMRWLLRFALVCHAAGIFLMVGAQGFYSLFAGAFVNALGSGAVEAACNPLVATIYPDKKTHKLNQFHMWFPGGIVIGGAGAYLMTRVGLDSWQLKLLLALLPTMAYGILFTGQYFPPTERVQSGVSFGGMIKETFLRPLFLVLLVCMMLTASLELGPSRWIPAVLEAGGVPGILVLVWVTGLMAVLRYFAGPVVQVLTNTGVLLLSAIVGGVGLALLSVSSGVVMIGVAATIFAFGVCYFWPTMLGTVAERIPKGGAMALAILGGAGGLFVNTVTIPVMGALADGYLHRELVFQGDAGGRPVDRTKETAVALQDVRISYARWAASLGSGPREALTQREIQTALEDADAVLDRWVHSGRLPETDTANALRAAIKNGPPDSVETDGPAAARAALAARRQAAALLAPAENKGGLMSFRYVAPISVFLAAVFGVMFVQDRRRAGRKPRERVAD
jgi:hypothetical protein